MTISRRGFVGSMTGAALGLPLLPHAFQDQEATPSGLVSGRRKALPYTAIEGFLSKEQVRWHHESHYGGALDGFVKLDADPTGEHRGRVAKANSVLLHELYFENMTAGKTVPGAASKSALERRFGAIDRWLADFRAAARAAQGWAVLAWHPVNGRLYNVSTDSHDDGPPWCGVPLLVVDVYEHAYYLDYQNRKGEYVDAFTAHIDWSELERRLRRCLA